MACEIVCHPALGHIKQKAVFPMETMKTASVEASIMLKVTVMALVVPFYGLKCVWWEDLHRHIKKNFLKNSTQRAHVP